VQLRRYLGGRAARVRRLITPRIELNRGAGGVDPRNAGNHLRVIRVRTKRRDQYRGGAAHERPRPVPLAFAGQRWMDHRRDRRRRVRSGVSGAPGADVGQGL
jgi:hypothetical protein